MANITVYYKGLTGILKDVTIDNGQTMSNLLTAIAADEGINSANYKISVYRNPSITDATAGTLAFNGVVSDDTIVCAVKDALTKELRQIQKLDIAQVKRQAGGDNTKPYYRTLNTYNINLLPNPYNGDLAAPDDGDPGPLNDGRPWT